MYFENTKHRNAAFVKDGSSRDLPDKCEPRLKAASPLGTRVPDSKFSGSARRLFQAAFHPLHDAAAVDHVVHRRPSFSWPKSPVIRPGASGCRQIGWILGIDDSRTRFPKRVELQPLATCKRKKKTYRMTSPVSLEAPGHDRKRRHRRHQPAAPVEIILCHARISDPPFPGWQSSAGVLLAILRHPLHHRLSA